MACSLCSFPSNNRPMPQQSNRPQSNHYRVLPPAQYSFLAVLVGLLALVANQIDAQNISVYDNSATYRMSFSNGGAADNNAGPGVAITQLVADDITFSSSAVGQSISDFGVSIANTDPTVSFSARIRVRFWVNDGPNGGPGTFIAGVSFDPITFTPGSHDFVFGTLAPGVFVLPASGTFWAGVTFDNATQNIASTATTAQLNELGEGIYDPPTIGSSADKAFKSTSSGSFFGVNNPPGTIFQSPFGGNPPANIGWQFKVYPVPEPSIWTIFVVGAVLLTVGKCWQRRNAVAFSDSVRK